MKKNYRMFATVNCILCQLCVFHANAAADRDTSNPFFELNHVMSTMSNTNHLSFNSVLYYENLAAAGLSRDTMSAQYKISGQKYYLKIDSVEIIQNNFYNLSVNKPDSVLIIERPKSLFTALLQFDMLNPTIQKNYLSSMRVIDSASTRRLSLSFRTNTPYISFDLVYDTSSYYLLKVSCKMRSYIIAEPATQAGLASYYTQVQQVFSNYQVGTFTDSVFATDPYFTRQNGQLTAVNAYAHYEIVNQTLNK